MDKSLHSPGVEEAVSPSPGSPVSLAEWVELIRGFFRRQYSLIVFCLAAMIALTLVHGYTTAPRYTAHAMLLIDTAKMRVLQQQESFMSELPLDTAQVETQLELLKSEGIALAVIKELRLTEDPEFVGAQRGFIGAILDLVSEPFVSDVTSTRETASENDLTRRALSRFQSQRNVKRVGRTYIIDIDFTSANPGRAAAIANAIADAYIVDQLQAKYQATRRASSWLQDRIVELRDQAMAADRAVLEFKEKKNIIGMGGADGRLLSEQQVIDLNSQLSSARAATAETKAKLDRIQEVMSQDIPDAAVTDQLHNEIINRLRGQYLDLDRRYNIWAARYGPSHLAAVSLKTQMSELRRSMVDELGRLVESYKSDYEIAKTREEGLEKSLATLVSGAQLTNRDRLGLSELESRAKVYHSIHDSFLQRYMEATQQQSIPMTEARVITSATAPGAPSNAHLLRNIAIASVLGLAFGFGGAALREAIDRVFRTTRQVETILKTNCLAALPVVKTAGGQDVAPVARRATGDVQRAPAVKRVTPDLPRIFRHVLHEPLSSFAEGFRAVKIAADIGAAIKENKVIGLTSSLPNEGKSTASCNFAQLVASSGAKVILVDGDLRNPTLTHKLAPKADLGLLQVLSGKADLGDAIHVDEMSGLHFLPAVIESRLAHSSDILASEAVKQLFDSLRKIYDYVIVDFPPLAPVVDVRATTKFVDSYVFVIEWGRTRINLVQRQLGAAPEIFERLLGVILNKANARVMERYEDYYGRYYYYKKRYYSRYGYYTH